MKMIRVASCLDCPHMKMEFKYFSKPYCAKFNVEDIPDVDVIPEWCPLEDYKSEES